MATATKTRIKFKLGRRSAMWNPNVAGFDGLNTMLDPPVTEGEAVLEDNPDLYKRVILGIRTGVLDKIDEQGTPKTSRKDKAIDTKTGSGEKTPLPSNDELAKDIMNTHKQPELLEFIAKCQDIAFLSILIELEMMGQNMANRRRDAVYESLKKRIVELETPLI